MKETMDIINELEEELVKINNPSLINKLHIIRLDYATLLLEKQVSVEPVVKPACETDKENIKYTCHYGKPIKYRTSFDI